MLGDLGAPFLNPNVMVEAMRHRRLSNTLASACLIRSVSAMALRKIAVVSLLTGIGVSAASAGLIALGGWGPCGPGSTTAAFGGFLIMMPVGCLTGLFPSIDAFAGRHHADWALLLVWPAMFWAALAYLTLAVVRQLGRYMQGKP